MKDNKLIAEFLGWKKGKGDDPRWKEEWFNKYGVRMTDGLSIILSFHTSWDWLMPVIHRIRDHVNVDMGFEEYDDWRINFKQIDPYNYNIEQCHKAVVEFIKWYNKQLKSYPFNEGDDYWTIEDGDVTWSCWDDMSVELHHLDPDKKYFKSEEEATKRLIEIDYSNQNNDLTCAECASDINLCNCNKENE